MYGYDEYFEEPGAFDQEVESFKQSLRDSVKKEIAETIEKLKATVTEQKGKLANLTALELAAEQKRNEYERRLSNVERDTRQKVEREGIRKLLEVLAEPRYRIGNAYIGLPKCNRCDEYRTVKYISPLGRTASEQCECAVRKMVYEVQEQLVHEISKRNRELVVWYSSTKRFFTSDDDTIGSGTVLKDAAGVPDEDLMEDPAAYGYASKEDAQRIADALNKLREDANKEGMDPWL